MDIVYTILAFLIGFSLMVVVHEWGHYITGKMFGVKIDEFAIGMGPRIYTKWGKKTIFSIRALPIGGFVKFTGDGESYGEQTSADSNDPNILPNIKVWKRFVIYAAGAVMNVILGFVLLVVFFACTGTFDETPRIGDVIPGSPAEEYGLMAEDIILKLNGTDIMQDNLALGSTQISEILNTDSEVVFTVLRNGELIEIGVTPQLDDETGTYKAGFHFAERYIPSTFKQVMSDSVTFSGELMTAIYETLGRLIFKGEGVENVSGPVGIVTTVNEFTKLGFLPLIYLFAALSLNLAVMNMLPFPALDGGKCVLLIIEAIRRKPMKPEVEGWLNFAGFAVLMLLMLLITYKDVVGLF